MSFPQRLKRLRKAAGLTQRELGMRLGVTYSSIHQWESGETVPRAYRLRQIADALNVNESALLGFSQTLPEGVPPAVMIPLLNWKQISDLGGKVTSAAINDEQPIDWIPGFGALSDSAFALTVEGEAMDSPYSRYTYPEGTIIVVDPSVDAEVGHRVVAIQRNTGEHTFRELAVDGSRQFLKPLNPQYPAKELTDDWQIVGVVVSTYRREI